MTQYVAFLRAINVGGNRVIKMDRLKELFTEAGYKNVKTYIQTGNVIFESDIEDTAAIEDKIGDFLQNALGFEVPTCVRSFYEMKTVIENNPFPSVTPNKDLQIYVAFLQTLPGENAAEIIKSMQNEQETYHINGREVYIMVKKHVGASLFSNNYLEKKLKIVATTRNLATVHKVMQ